jgi:alpha-beta hydrolase superfamily lysophospholipase
LTRSSARRRGTRHQADRPLGGCIGNRSTIVPIVDAKHDVFLSVPESRQAAYRALDQWLDWYLAETSDAATQSERG